MSGLSAGTVLRKTIKAAVLPVGFLTPARPKDAVLLLYHRVGAGSREIDLSSSAFRAQVEYLQERGLVRSLGDALDGDGGVVLTFDDGFRDFHDTVLPILVRHGMPAVLYLATSFVGPHHGPLPDDGAALSWRQLEECISTGLVTVGSHTHSHADLSLASPTQVEDEMQKSKSLIEDRLGLACSHFSFPWSVASPSAEQLARRLFDSAALRWSTNRSDRIDRYRLGRTPVLRSDGAAFFRAKVRGRLDGEATAYRLLRRGPWRR
jgi:peptidoglycan/xylan/chitin deacetylase (PgdA/CDA1 family)